jgi:hypothetical protein
MGTPGSFRSVCRAGHVWLGGKWRQLCQSMKAAMFRSATAARSDDALQEEPTSLVLNERFDDTQRT